LPAADLRDRLGHRVDAAYFLSEPTVITRNGEPRAVLISYAEWGARKEQESEDGRPPA
jgi:prevent-host-death family protein